MRKLESIIETQQFDRELLEHLFKEADNILWHHRRRTGIYNTLEGKQMVFLYAKEDSFKTRFGFQRAMKRCGGDFDKGSLKTFSSQCGETDLLSGVSFASQCADVVALRDYPRGTTQELASRIDVPFINAGEEGGQHPTQALVDLYIIHHKKTEIDGVSVALVGDMRPPQGRTIRSLAYLLRRFDDVKLYFITTDEQKDPEFLSWLKAKKVKYEVVNSLDPVVEKVDCIYMTQGKFKLTTGHVLRMKEDAIITHPLPRGPEIDKQIDLNHRAVYLDEGGVGMYIRMAVFTYLLERRR